MLQQNLLSVLVKTTLTIRSSCRIEMEKHSALKVLGQGSLRQQNLLIQVQEKIMTSERDTIKGNKDD